MRAVQAMLLIEIPIADKLLEFRKRWRKSQGDGRRRHGRPCAPLQFRAIIRARAHQ